MPLNLIIDQTEAALDSLLDIESNLKTEVQNKVRI